MRDGKKYWVDGYRVLVQQFDGPNFRAFTNHREAAALIRNELEYRSSRENAQFDLDFLAKKHGWKAEVA